MTFTAWDVVLIVAGLFAAYDIFEARGRAFTSWAVLLVVIVLIFR